MKTDQIREQIATSMHRDCDEKWFVILEDTTPNHYGVENLAFELAVRDIWVDLRKKSFTFKNGALSFNAQLLASSEKDGVNTKVRRVVSGEGTFEFGGASDIRVVDFEINEKIDLLEE